MARNSKQTAAAELPIDDAARIADGTHADPFSVLGPHRHGRATYVTAFDPAAGELWAVVSKKRYPLDPVNGAPGVYFGKVPGGKPYRLKAAASWGVLGI